MPLPFDLPALSRGFSDVSPSARALGVEAAGVAARSLSSLLGREVAIRGRALPGAPLSRDPTARRTVELGAVPAAAAVEIEPALVARLVDALAGGPGRIEGAGSLTPVEAAALDLFLAAALDGACSVAAIESGLAPRLARDGAEVSSPLAVELEVVAGEIAGRARLLLPAAAVRALRGEDAPAKGGGSLRLPASLRGGSAALTPGELDALSPGDVVLLDPPGDGLELLVLPGGMRASGRCADGFFNVEETTMTDRNAGLPVTLEVELARVEISLADLARLEPGMALPLGVDRRGLVTLRAGERAIARGELVELEGAVGVRILSIEVGP